MRVIRESCMTDEISQATGPHAAGMQPACPVGQATIERLQSFVNPDDTVLELGGRDGRFAVALAPFVSHYICSDAEDDLVSVAQARTRDLKNVECVNLSAQDASLPRHLDAVIAIDLLHTLDDIPHALSRIHGLLRPGGLLLSRTVTVEGTSQALRLPDLMRQMLGRRPKMTMIPPAALERMVRTAGFEIVSCDMVPRGSQNCMIVARSR